MASSARHRIFEQAATLSAIALRSFRQLRRLFTPRVRAMSGIALFGWALVLAFRVISLDAAHQLQQPALDFAICGGLGLLGLSISWIHFGERRPKAEPAEENTTPRLLTRRSPVAQNPQQAATTPLLPFRRLPRPPSSSMPLRKLPRTRP
jgi:hypothetical protein